MRIKIPLAIAMLALLAATSFGAPWRLAAVLILNIPFEFQVSHHSLPPGYYKIEQILASSHGRNLMVIRSLDGRIYQTFYTDAPRPQESDAASKIVFQRNSGRTVLSQVWSREERVVVDLAGIEAEIHKDVTSANEQDSEIALPCAQEILLAKSR